MADVTPDDVRQVAHLARIALTEDEVRQFQGELTQIVRFVEQLQSVTTAQVEPMTHVLSLTNVLREDTAQPCLGSEVVTALAPATQGAFVKVPKVLE